MKLTPASQRALWTMWRKPSPLDENEFDSWTHVNTRTPSPYFSHFWMSECKPSNSFPDSKSEIVIPAMESDFRKLWGPSRPHSGAARVRFRFPPSTLLPVEAALLPWKAFTAFRIASFSASWSEICFKASWCVASYFCMMASGILGTKHIDHDGATKSQKFEWITKPWRMRSWWNPVDHLFQNNISITSQTENKRLREFIPKEGSWRNHLPWTGNPMWVDLPGSSLPHAWSGHPQTLCQTIGLGYDQWLDLGFVAWRSQTHDTDPCSWYPKLSSQFHWGQQASNRVGCPSMLVPTLRISRVTG